MVKIFVIWASIFVMLCLSSIQTELGLNAHQFALKSLSENTLQGYLYQPLKMYTKVIEESFSDEELHKALSFTLVASAKVISDLLLTKPSTGKIRLGENNRCAGTLLSQIIQRDDIDADIAVFIASNKEEGKTITSKKCEVNENKYIKAIALNINAEEFSKLEKISQVKEICVEIANVLYGDEEEKQALMSELDEYMAKKKNIEEIKLGSCISGQNNCSQCLDSNNCISCDSGYFLHYGDCNRCIAPCDLCSSQTACITCKNPSQITLNSSEGTCTCNDPNAFFSSSSNTCQCSPEYFSGRDGLCEACSPQCKTCSGYAFNCLTCIDHTHMSAIPDCNCPTNSALVGASCVCKSGYYFSSNKVCSTCAPQCSTCSVSAASCIQCNDPTHMSAAPVCACPANGKFSGRTCKCDAGYYFSSSTVCSACNNNCATCQDAFTCVTCSDTTHMSAAPACACPYNGYLSGTTCVCNAGYYFSSSTVCSACNDNCATCQDAATCVTCSDPTHMSAAPVCACPANGYLSGTTCVCNAGYYFSSNTVCSPACNTNCATCQDDFTCLTCIDTTHMSAAPTCACPYNGYLSGTTCVCNAGYYFSSNIVCSACNNNCATCQDAATCVTCSDPTHMSAAPACACPANGYLSGTTCVCNAGYYFSSNTVCSPACNTNCATCQAGSATCLTCIDTTHMSAAPACSCPTNSSLTNSSCVCNSGYYYSSSKTCSQCAPPCTKCRTSATKCTACVTGTILNATTGTCTCIDPNSSFDNSSGACVCNPGYFENSGVCATCNNPNMAWNATTGNCTCADPNASFNPGTLQCQCNKGYFNIEGVCTGCFAPCLTCWTLPNFCTSCYDATHMVLYAGVCKCVDPNASFNLTSQTCQCNQGYYLSSSGVCQPCIAPCAQCLNSATFCTVCDDFMNMNLNTTAGTCTCKDSNVQFNPWLKACTSCQCGSITNNIFNFN